MDERLKAILYQSPERLPVRVGLLPATWMRYGKDLQALCARYPEIFGDTAPDAHIRYYVPPTYHAGRHKDPWGCVWENVAEGYEAIVTGHPVGTREDVHRLLPPKEDMGFPHGFMFLRLTDLRGFEEMMIDFAQEPPELQALIDIVLEYNMRQARLRLAKTAEGDVVHFGDDLGMQHALPISPVKWRKYLKPCFEAIYAPFRDAGRVVYMHTDGCIYEIIPDLIECGVQVLNPQIRANGLERLVDTCRGKVCVDLDLDRQFFPFATPKQLDEHIRECVEALYTPEGGLMLTAECGADVPLENIEAICGAMMKYRDYRG